MPSGQLGKNQKAFHLTSMYSSNLCYVNGIRVFCLHLGVGITVSLNLTNRIINEEHTVSWQPPKDSVIHAYDLRTCCSKTDTPVKK